MVLLVATEGAFVSPGITVSAEEAAVLASDVPVATELDITSEGYEDTVLST